MKRTRYYSALVVLLVLILSTACGKAGGPADPMGSPGNPQGQGNSDIPSELVAAWTFQSLQVGDNQVDIGAFMEWEEETASAHIKIAADGSVLYTELDDDNCVVCSLNGTMSVSGDNFSYVISDEFEGQNIEKESSGIWAVNGNQLTFTMYQGDVPAVFLLTR